GKDIAVRREDVHNATVSKDGQYHLETGVIDYQVAVSSQGTTSDITLTDTLGSALDYLTDAQHNGGVVFDAAASVNSANTAPVITQKTGNTFSVVIPQMNDGDRLVFNYSAKVDYNRIAVSGAPTFEETGNTAQIFGDSYTVDNTAMYHEDHIEFSDLEKNLIHKQQKTVNGIFGYVLTWEIDTNKRAQFPLAGTVLTDTIGETVQSISKYTGDGVTIRCYSDDGVLRDTRSVSWAELGVDLQNDVTWTYRIPDTDPQ
ncbi:hypothetical protein, partial [uncultured Ruminococcus sp.]|uniref:hypothetical protein n=1 Tax=uncultured Ruminococcus sp. TaxID=165186 RepID=UPI00292F5003